MTAIKVCGITRAEDAELCALLGIERIGLNFWAGSARRCTHETAAEIVELVGDRIEIVAITVDASESELRAIVDLGIRRVQLHGDAPGVAHAGLPVEAYEAVRLEGEGSVERALAAAGDEVLVDAFVSGMPGGTGAPVDRGLAARVAMQRRTWVAGGLAPENVAEVIAVVRPYGVDVASGVERAPGVKDEARVRSFVHAVRGSR